MDNRQLPVDIVHWGLALLPIVALLVLLVPLRWRAPEAGPIGMFVAAIVALVVFQAPLETISVAGAKGVWDALFILYVVWPALLFYHVGDRAGAFDALRQGITSFSRNELFVVLALGWVFSSFLQGIAGFGTPIAVVAPLLVAIGMRPVYAVAIPIIAHLWAKFFGTLGVGWLATLQVVDLADVTATAFQAGLLLIIQVVLGGFTVAWMYGRWPAVRQAIPFVLIISAIQGGGQLVMTLVDPVLSAFIAATAALVALYPLSRWRPYAEPVEGIDERPAMREEARDQGDERHPVMGMGMSLLPYVVLVVTTIGVLVIPPVTQFLEGLEAGLPFPAITTGYGVEVEAADPYSPFAPLTHPGTFLLLTSVVTWLMYRSRGYYGAWAEREETESIWRGLANDAIPASVPVIAFLVMSKVMDHSGQTDVLALGIAEIAPPLVFAFLANAIGALGAFMTSSSTSSNVLFSDLQQSVAELRDLPESTVIAAQSAGGALGNAVAPANVVLGASTAGISGREGEVLRITIRWTLLAVVLTGIVTLALVALQGG